MKQIPDESLAVETSANNDVDPFFYKLTKQIILGGVYISIGLSAEMVGPTLPDLKDRIGVDYEEISRALVGKSIGTMIGAVAGGFLHEILYKQTDLILTIALLILATGSYLTPWSTSVAMAFACFTFGGISEGLINTGANTMVMHLWTDKAAAPMHSMHFCFGLGALLAPQIARPFLSPEQDNITSATTVSTEDSEDLSRIEIPYSFVATLIVLFSFVMLAFYIKGPPKEFPVRKNATRFSEMISPGSCTGGHSCYGIAMILCVSFYFVQAIGGERAYGKFLFSYAYETELLSKDQASVLQSVFWLSFTTGRLLGIPLTKFLPLSIVIIGDICIVLISALSLAIFATDNVNILWVFTSFIGLGIALAFPNGMCWANLHLLMNSVAVMVLIVGGSCGGFVYQYLTGYLFENQGPETLMYIMVGYGVCLVLSYVLMVLVSNTLNPRHTSYEIDDNFELEDFKRVSTYSKY